MDDPDYTTISTLIILGMLLAVFALPDLVAVIVIATTLTGLALRGLQERAPDPRERAWRQGQEWWR